MSTIISLEEPNTPALQSFKPQDEAVWNAWLARNAAQEKHKHALRMQVAAWSCIGLLLSAAGLSFQHAFVSPVICMKVLQFVLTLGAVAFAWKTILYRWYVLGIVFIAVALLFNPLLASLWLFRSAPLLIVSALPFVLGAHWIKHRVQTAASSSEVLHAK